MSLMQGQESMMESKKAVISLPFKGKCLLVTRQAARGSDLLECGACDDRVENSINVLAHILNEHRVASLHGPLHGSHSAGSAHAHNL